MVTAVTYVGSRIENIKGTVAEESVSPHFSVEQARSFGPIFGFLNDKDRDILYLIFVSQKKQKDVQAILGRSQPSLCYDIKRIRKRLRFIFYLHSVFDIFLNFVNNRKEDFTTTEMEILTLMFYTSSFTMAAEILGLSQVKVRYSYNKCLSRMEEMELWEPYEIFMVIRSNLNIIRRVYQSEGEDCSESLPLPL